MKFYTSVEQAGDTILVRGYNEGKPYQDRVKFNPTLFLPSPDKSEWRTLDGKYPNDTKGYTLRVGGDKIKDNLNETNTQIRFALHPFYQLVLYFNHEVKLDSGETFTKEIESKIDARWEELGLSDLNTNQPDPSLFGYVLDNLLRQSQPSKSQ